ncbi:hydrogenase assembly protein HypC [Veillonella montpellierensis DNF00314]|uniref:Hydrogenase assembly protein HypC n=1 Tax=Veillonella montpellierensis DNF00314 TaxID=1401067 RepID=A0A096AIG2_9FIRM|nr:HypC/HybG/HupF family hydrogenase formation chaperone [Veillonella montpellierensis]KGF46898.1 hydrogenase assembly protein HypC [Veillonella montpellierensis DNF00314]
MCLAVPAQLVKINESLGTIEVSGVTRDCSLLLVPEAKIGDWVLVHAGFAVQIVDEEEAKATMDAFRELEELEQTYFKEQEANSRSAHTEN